MQPARYSYLAILLVSGLLLLAGCAPPPVKPDLTRYEAAAAAMEADGKYASAADTYQLMANRSPAPYKQDYLLKAVAALLQAGQSPSADQLLRSIDIKGLPADYRLRKQWLRAEIELAQGRGQAVPDLLTTPPDEDAPLALRRRYHELRAAAYRQTGNLIESAHELVQMDALLDVPGERLVNQQAILGTLAELSDTALRQLQPPPPDPLGGWMELARLLAAYIGDADQLQVALSMWREQYPAHPIEDALFAGLETRFQPTIVVPNHIAVLLPRSGPFAKPAAALRTGFLAAHFDRAPDERPRIRFYDSSNADEIELVYREAAESGAELVVGPLSKTAVARLAARSHLEVPVLALNQVESASPLPTNLFQFGLAPEDEARQAADRAWADGHRNALTLTPSGSWGERIERSFQARWQALGGIVLEAQRYDGRETDFKAPIQQLLNLDQSRQRHQRLVRALGRQLEFEPRRRQDAQFIFLAASSRKAREIRPQIQFHRGSDLPLYATSRAYAGDTAAAANSDIEGLMFCDIPWLLRAGSGGTLNRARLSDILPESRGAQARLVAMGIDVYHLPAELNRLRAAPGTTYDGTTGELYLDPANRVHRNLVWARIRKGIPELMADPQPVEDYDGAIDATQPLAAPAGET